MKKIEELYIIRKIKIWLKYKSARFQLNNKYKALEKSMEFYPESRTAFEITKIQSRNMSSEIEYRPVSHVFYIDNGGKYVIMKNSSLYIVNGLQFFYVDMSSESMKYLDKYLKRIMERRHLKKTNEIDSKITRSLDDILDNLKQGEQDEIKKTKN